MASFLDTNKVDLPSYIPQYDTQLYGALIANKQQQYDSNFEKIQGQISSVGGLPILKDQDKNYLQQKINGITTNLNSMVGADWGSNQLVSKASGMVGQIASDKNIQNAVQAAQSIKMLQASQSDKKDKHPESYTPSAENWDNQAVESYLKDNTVGAAYKGPKEASTYYQYHDTLDKAMAALKPTITYGINSFGKYEEEVDKRTIKSPAEIMNLVNGVIGTHPEFQQSIAMDAAYSYKHYDATALGERISSGTQSIIDRYTKFNETYKKDGLINGNPATQKQGDDFIADNTKHIKDAQDYKDTYLKNLSDPKLLDQVKQTYFNDELRNTYALNYQEENTERTLRTNENMVKETEFANKDQELNLSYLKEGLDRNTGLPLSPDSPYYQWYINNNASKGGTGPGTAGNGSPITIQQPSAPTYTPEKNLENIATLDAKIGDNEKKLQGDWIGQNLHRAADKEGVALFSQWKANEENNIATGKPVDPDYQAYKKANQIAMVQKQAYQDLQKAADESAVSAHPFSSLDENWKNGGYSGDFTINGISLPHSNGVTTHDLHVNIAQSPKFVSIVSSVNTAFDKLNAQIAATAPSTFSKNKNNTNPTPLITEQQKVDNLNKALEPYKGRPEYNILKAVISSGGSSKFNEVADKTLTPVKELMSQRNTTSNKYFEDKGLQLNPQGKDYSSKAGQDAQRGNAMAAFQANHLGTKADPDKIQPIRGYYMPVTGESMMQYNYDGTFYDEKVPVEPGAEPFGPRVRGAELIHAIEASPYHMTPTEGPAVLNTENTKVRYAISKSASTGTYNIVVLDGARKIKVPIEVNGVNQPITNPTDAQKAVEDLSKLKMKDGLINGTSGVPLTRQQIIDYALKRYQQ